MAFCPFCGHDNDASYVACVQCGELLPQQAQMRAPHPAESPRQAPPTRRDEDPSHTQRNLAGPRSQVANATQFLDTSDHESTDPSSRAAGSKLLGNVKLVVEQGMILGEQFLLNDATLMIGRFDAGAGQCPDIDLSAQDPSFVHRQHARIEFQPDGVSIVVFDLGGRNGVYVNNVQVPSRGSARLSLNDKLRVGRVVMRLKSLGEADQHGTRG